MTNGIIGRRAPELLVPYWIDAQGIQRPPVTLDELGSQHRMLFFYQHWCSGCHLHGFPSLLALVDKSHSKNVGFAIVQTAFEGHDVNTQDKLVVDQRRYGLRVPFGHEGKTPSGAYPTTVENFRAGGTPWFVTIDPAGVVMQNGFAIDADEFIASVERRRLAAEAAFS
ncbi:TlpA family protein disulfide reductase [Acidisoma sp. L85]|uniref:TlpA family protein disulfide reductase n=1 Tax=Acidisoma sp. L85 TaxID=1641850 RepID=UPI00131C66FD|nr:TlpA family protein disulfide reductase [Acidisoma sp. L85]